ncbi:phthalate 4,5-dioxygenase [Kibdelosporangium aridum]|uniref:Phthalate 4,5-dioxygenase n=1 Tax=Kibdelosporangium aridum TaxID=2030 RepID=A0A428ZHC2_KIBAR|nr:iron-sulfur cluster-binding domain-containing protein [Kibdelosporangium aridum]RSM87455.1 phthalate 4,5-dioxygenase [Kibdelosporangium aridum]
MDGLPAWSELDAIGREFGLGGVRVRAVHRTTSRAQTHGASAPVNRFPLEPSPRYLFIAGASVGITPIRAMVRRLRGDGRTHVRLLYLTRSAEETAFLQEFDGPEDIMHHSDERGPLDLWPYLAVPDDDVRIYCCGPAALARSVRTLTAHWRMSRIHMEEFATGRLGMSAPFTAVWGPDGRRVDVPAHLSLLAALRRDGVRVDSSCEAGVCGTCRLSVLDGEVEHRDCVLTETQRVSSLLACVGRGPGQPRSSSVPARTRNPCDCSRTAS